jgi:putative nucleotidyltransferase with HDIG domain
MEAQPFSTLRVNDRDGLPSIPEREHDEWATAHVEISSGTLTIGYLFVARSDGERFNAQDHAVLDGIAAHAGTALGRAALFGRIRDDYAKTLGALSSTLDVAEHRPAGHSTRVMDYAMLIGEELGLPFEDIEQLRFAGLLHDIGKTGVPQEILLKPSKLTAEEYARVQAHAEFGATVVDHIEFLRGLTPVILYHHERWDGEGYPERLAGDAIPLLARILAVADAYDALSTRGPGKQRNATLAIARHEIEAGSGVQFDPRVVVALLSGLDRMVIAGKSGLLAPADSHGRPDLPA